MKYIDRFLHKISIIQDEKEYVEDIRKEIREEQKNNLKRTVEILAIFSAIVIFSSSSIQLYSNINNLKAAIAFTLCFASALSLFGFLLYAIVRLENTKKTPVIFSILILCIFIITGWYLWKGENISLEEKTPQLLPRSIKLDFSKKSHIPNKNIKP